MKDAFYFILRALLVIKILKFLSCLFGYVEKQLGQKDKVHFKILTSQSFLTNNYNTHIAQYLTNKRQPDTEIWSGNRI